MTMIRLKCSPSSSSTTAAVETEETSTTAMAIEQSSITTTTTKTKTLNNSTELLKRLESINWLCSFNTILNGKPTTLLIKYLFDDEEEKSYAILLTDFAQTFFECTTGQQNLEKNYLKYNKTRLIQYVEKSIIIQSLKLLIKSMTETIKNVEKLSVDCHTTRITLRCAKQISQKFHIKWTFHLISTDDDIFIKHLSMPMFRGLIYYYNLSHQQQMMDVDNSTNDDIDNNENSNESTTISIESDQPFSCIDNNLLNKFFR